MTLQSLFLRFFLIYLVLLAVLAVVVHFVGVDGGPGVSMAVLLTAVLYPCQAFGTKNGRYLNSSEKTDVVLGMIAINLVIKGAISYFAFTASGQGHPPSMSVLFGLLLAGFIDGVVILFAVRMAGSLVAKDLAKRAK